MTGIGDMTPEEAAALEASGNTAEQQADFAASQAASSGGAPLTSAQLVSNASAQAYNTIGELFPPGWGSEGETPEGTTWNNAVEGLWLPLVLPDATEGPWGNFPVKPHGIFYADTRTNIVGNTQDHECGGAHSSPEVDSCRVNVAERYALDAAGVTGGTGAGVREMP